MHVIDLLSSSMFDVQIKGRAGSIADIFSDWNVHDRFGLLIYEPLGGLGASHLLQTAITSFYDVKPSSRADRKVYPEIYAIHVGKGWGTHVWFDFWPTRREVILSSDPREVLDAINDRGITRLAIPERLPHDFVHRPKEEDAALDRIVTTVTYGASGRVDKPDFSIRGNDRRTESNPQNVLRRTTISSTMIEVARQTQTPVKEADPELAAWLSKRADDITAEERKLVEQRRLALRQDGLVTETYRFTPTAEVLKSL